MSKEAFILPMIQDEVDKDSPFVNCIRKNYRHIRKWAKRTMTNAFRIYDREVPRYPLAIDFYAGRYCIHYYSPKRDHLEPSEELVEETNHALQKLLGAQRHEIFWRVRAKNKETRQYEKVASSKHFFYVFEYGVKFKVNLEDYLDTGLFLDHRETRRLVALQCKGKRLLNLFAYTCSFSVHAAMQGALFTKSVDLSNTYTLWGEDNFILNDLSLKSNRVIRADCLKYLDEERVSAEKYDVIVIDPPTISRSKKMDQLFDIQQDYQGLLIKALFLLNDGGVLFFSTNSRKFVLDKNVFEGWRIADISTKTACAEFQGKIHQSWKFFK
ncbi:MAG: class I SAM-dependent methyltransferase [Parachlamydiaceae bacterium]